MIKKVITLSISVFSYFISHSQIAVLNIEKPIKIGVIKSAGLELASLSYTHKDKDTLYTLTYRDMNYKQIMVYKDIKFEETGGVLNSLYSICKSTFLEKDKEINFKLGEDYTFLIGSRLFGLKYVTIGATNKGYSMPLLETQIDKLFGKN